MHFDSAMSDMFVEILYQTLDKVLSLEKTELIRLYRPKFNKVHLWRERNVLAQDSLKKCVKRFKQPKYLKRLNSDNTLSAYNNLVIEFIQLFWLC